MGPRKYGAPRAYRQWTRGPGWQDRTRSTHVITFDRRPSLLNALNETLTQDLNAFLQTQTFPDLYRAYAWKNDTYANGFPDIYGLESRLVMMACSQLVQPGPHSGGSQGCVKAEDICGSCSLMDLLWEIVCLSLISWDDRFNIAPAGPRGANGF